MKARLAFCAAVFFSISLTGSAGHFLQPAGSGGPQLVVDSGGHTAPVTAIAFTKDDKYLVTAGVDKLVRVWDLTTGKTVRTIRGETGDGQWGAIQAAGLTSDNRFLAVGGQLASQDDIAGIGKVRLHEFSDTVKNGEVRADLPGLRNVVTAITTSPRNNYVAAGGILGDVCIWALNPPKFLKCAQLHTERITSLAFSPDEKQLASSSADQRIELSGVSNLQSIAVMQGHKGAVTSIAYLSKSSILSSSDDGTLRLWDASKGSQQRVVLDRHSPVSGLAVDSDGRRALLCSYESFSICEVLSLPAANVVSRFSKHNGPVTATALSHDGRLAATAGGLNNEVFVWDTGNGQEKQRLAGSGARVASVGFRKDGQSVAFASEWLSTTADTQQLQQKIAFTQDGVSLGNLDEGQDEYLRELHEIDGVQLRLRPGRRTTLELVRNGNTEATITRTQAEGSYHLAFSLTPNGRFIVSGGRGGYLALYDLQGHEIRRFVGHMGEITTLAISGDSKKMVSGASDQLIKVWDLERQTDNLLDTIFVSSNQEWVAWEPGGHYVSSLHGDKFVGWHMNNGSKAADFFPLSTYSARYYDPKLVAAGLVIPSTPPPLPPVANPERPEPPAPPEVRVQVDRQPDGKIRVVATATSKRADILDIKILMGGSQVPATTDITPDARNRTAVARIDPSEFPELGVVAEPKEPTDPKEPKHVDIEAIAQTADAKTNSRTTFEYKPTTSPLPAPVRRLFLLAVGISQYMDSRFNLVHPATDAKSLVDFFNTHRDPEIFQEVIPKVLTNSDANRNDINEQLKWLGETPRATDIRILFLSGHGFIDGDDYFFGGYGYSETSVPENTSLSWYDIYRRLKNAPGKTLVIVDTCHSGGMVRGRTKTLVRKQDLTNMLKKLELDTQPGLVTIAASTSQETVTDDSEFFKALLNGLSGDAVAPNDPLIDVLDLASFLTGKVQEATRNAQHVIIWGDESVLKDQFPLASNRRR